MELFNKNCNWIPASAGMTPLSWIATQSPHKEGLGDLVSRYLRFALCSFYRFPQLGKG